MGRVQTVRTEQHSLLQPAGARSDHTGLGLIPVRGRHCLHTRGELPPEFGMNGVLVHVRGRNGRRRRSGRVLTLKKPGPGTLK